MDPKLTFGLLVGAGAIFRGVFSFINKRKEDPSIKWNWVIFASEAVPAFAIGFMTGAAWDQPFTAISAISAFFFGAGFTSVVSKASFRKK